MENYHPDSKFVTQQDAVRFKNWTKDDEAESKRANPYYTTINDRTEHFRKDRQYFLVRESKLNHFSGYCVDWFLSGTLI